MAKMVIWGWHTIFSDTHTHAHTCARVRVCVFVLVLVLVLVLVNGVWTYHQIVEFLGSGRLNHPESLCFFSVHPCIRFLELRRHGVILSENLTYSSGKSTLLISFNRQSIYEWAIFPSVQWPEGRWHFRLVDVCQRHQEALEAEEEWETNESSAWLIPPLETAQSTCAPFDNFDMVSWRMLKGYWSLDVMICYANVCISCMYIYIHIRYSTHIFCDSSVFNG